MASHARLAISFSLALLMAATVRAEDGRSGERIYRQQCASCHGAAGEGTPVDYPKPLAGSRSIAQLTRLIAKTMPEDKPGTCVGEDAESVSAYIYEAFYSPTAQARNQPARIELARLTNRQYRNAIADLFASYRGKPPQDDKRGLQAEYFRERDFRRDRRVFERIDSQVNLHFGAERPEGFPPVVEPKEPEKPKLAPEPPKDEKDKKEKTEAEKQKEREERRKEREKQRELEKKQAEARQRAKEFVIRWQGSVFAPETGDYEFVVRTENAFELWVNAPQRPLIEARVKSGNDTEYRETIRLLGGRTYAIRLDYIRGAEKTGSVALEWKPPSGVVGVIPTRFLSPTKAPETFVLDTTFPPDDRSYGYERGASVSAAWEQATTDAAIEVANEVVSRLRELTDVLPSAKGREARVREFCRAFLERAFRRPLTDQEILRYIDRQFARSPDVETAVKRSILLALKSPNFLYREVGGQGNEPYEVAARMAFELWDSIPDAALRQAASEGKLSTREQIREQAWRMVGDPRTNAKLRDFFFQWLKVDPAPDLSKDRAKISGFDEGMIADLRTSLELFLDDLIASDSADFRQLMLSDSTYLNGRLAKFYGADLPPDAPFQKVALNPTERAGVLSHPYLMATFAYSSTTSPIHRGVFLSRNVLGRTLRPPPEAVAPLAPDLHASLSTRERVTLQTSPNACQSCHGMINPLGFSLERFDAVGRFRSEEKGKPIDAAGTYQVGTGETETFDGARALGAFLARSDEAQSAFVEHLFHAIVKQPVLAYGSQTLPNLRQYFASHEFNIRKLVVEMVSETALSGQKADSNTVAHSIP